MLTEDGDTLLPESKGSTQGVLKRSISTDSEVEITRRRSSGDSGRRSGESLRRLSKDSGEDVDGQRSRRSSTAADDRIARELRETFETLDIDSSGFVDPANIKEVMSRLGESLTGLSPFFARRLVLWPKLVPSHTRPPARPSCKPGIAGCHACVLFLAEEEAKKMVGIADYKQNGVIDYDEFVQLMSSESKVLVGVDTCGSGRALPTRLVLVVRPWGAWARRPCGTPWPDASRASMVIHGHRVAA